MFAVSILLLLLVTLVQVLQVSAGCGSYQYACYCIYGYCSSCCDYTWSKSCSGPCADRCGESKYCSFKCDGDGYNGCNPNTKPGWDWCDNCGTWQQQCNSCFDNCGVYLSCSVTCSSGEGNCDPDTKPSTTKYCGSCGTWYTNCDSCDGNCGGSVRCTPSCSSGEDNCDPDTKPSTSKYCGSCGIWYGNCDSCDGNCGRSVRCTPSCVGGEGNCDPDTKPSTSNYCDSCGTWYGNCDSCYGNCGGSVSCSPSCSNGYGNCWSYDKPSTYKNCDSCSTSGGSDSSSSGSDSDTGGNSSYSSNYGSNLALIAGLIGGGVLLVVGIVYCIWSRRKKSASNAKPKKSMEITDMSASASNSTMNPMLSAELNAAAPSGAHPRKKPAPSTDIGDNRHASVDKPSGRVPHKKASIVIPTDRSHRDSLLNAYVHPKSPRSVSREDRNLDEWTFAKVRDAVGTFHETFVVTRSASMTKYWTSDFRVKPEDKSEVDTCRWNSCKSCTQCLHFMLKNLILLMIYIALSPVLLLYIMCMAIAYDREECPKDMSDFDYWLSRNGFDSQEREIFLSVSSGGFNFLGHPSFKLFAPEAKPLPDRVSLHLLANTLFSEADVKRATGITDVTKQTLLVKMFAKWKTTIEENHEKEFQNHADEVLKVLFQWMHVEARKIGDTLVNWACCPSMTRGTPEFEMEVARAVNKRYNAVLRSVNTLVKTGLYNEEDSRIKDLARVFNRKSKKGVFDYGRIDWDLFVAMDKDHYHRLWAKCQNSSIFIKQSATEVACSESACGFFWRIFKRYFFKAVVIAYKIYMAISEGEIDCDVFYELFSDSITTFLEDPGEILGDALEKGVDVMNSYLEQLEDANLEDIVNDAQSAMAEVNKAKKSINQVSKLSTSAAPRAKVNSTSLSSSPKGASSPKGGKLSNAPELLASTRAGSDAPRPVSSPKNSVSSPPVPIGSQRNSGAPPPDVAGGSDLNMQQFLEAHNLSHLYDSFVGNGIDDPSLLSSLTDTDIASLGINVGNRVKLRKALSVSSATSASTSRPGSIDASSSRKSSADTSARKTSAEGKNSGANSKKGEDSKRGEKKKGDKKKDEKEKEGKEEDEEKEEGDDEDKEKDAEDEEAPEEGDVAEEEEEADVEEEEEEEVEDEEEEEEEVEEEEEEEVEDEDDEIDSDL